MAEPQRRFVLAKRGESPMIACGYRKCLDRKHHRHCDGDYAELMTEADAGKALKRYPGMMIYELVPVEG